MTIDKQKKPAPHDPAKDARREAEKDIDNDPDFTEGNPTDDLDEGELARRDNSDEGAFDALEKKRPRGGDPRGGDPHADQAGEPHSGKTKEK